MKCIKDFFKKLFNWLWQCQSKNCNGRIKHIWEETICNIYKCDKCWRHYI